jgi:hypothetical protein
MSKKKCYKVDISIPTKLSRRSSYKGHQRHCIKRSNKLGLKLTKTTPRPILKPNICYLNKLMHFLSLLLAFSLYMHSRGKVQCIASWLQIRKSRFSHYIYLASSLNSDQEDRLHKWRHLLTVRHVYSMICFLRNKTQLIHRKQCTFLIAFTTCKSKYINQSN